MMNTNIRIAIAYGSKRTREIASVVADKLKIMASIGYPVKVDFIDKKRDDLITEQRLKNGNFDGGNSGSSIAKTMEEVFMSFDCAIFLFDHRKLSVYDCSNPIKDNHLVIKDEEYGKQERDFHLISGNLLFEYGMAMSIFEKRRSISEISPVLSFALSKLDENLYAFRLDPIELLSLTNEQIVHEILNAIHKHFVEPNFYGMPRDLPHNIEDKSWIQDPMALTKDNSYFPDLSKLTPKAVNVSLDQESSVLRNIFIKEYELLLPKDNETQNISLMIKRLLYMVDRAVLIMYLDKGVNNNGDRDYWYNQAHTLILDLNDTNEKYLKESAIALKAVLGYQDRGRRNVSLDDISRDLVPIYRRGKNIGNRMVYTLCADYLSLCYLNGIWSKFKKLKDTNGNTVFENGLDMHSLEDMTHFRDVLNYNLENNYTILDEIATNLKKAIIALNAVIECEDELIGVNNRFVKNASKWYLWKSYAGYNKARCEWLLYFMQQFSSKYTDLNVSNWYNTMKESVYSRQYDYEKAQNIPGGGFPQVISFNFQAEYFVALYNLKIITLIAKKLISDFSPEELLNEKSVDMWIRSSVYLGDTLGVSELFSTYKIISIKEQTPNAIKKLENSNFFTEEEKIKLRELLLFTEDAVISKDKLKGKLAKKLWDNTLISLRDITVNLISNQLIKKGIDIRTVDGFLNLINNITAMH